jgi:hypothetical protein
MSCFSHILPYERPFGTFSTGELVCLFTERLERNGTLLEELMKTCAAAAT